eukprot:scaffold288930_cov34-Prasinocladus_malaysianus.AAC.1
MGKLNTEGDWSNQNNKLLILATDPKRLDRAVYSGALTPVSALFGSEKVVLDYNAQCRSWLLHQLP